MPDGTAKSEEMSENMKQLDGLAAITKITAKSPTQHFKFSLTQAADEEDGESTFIINAPIIYGGYASDGCIVGVLSTRICPCFPP